MDAARPGPGLAAALASAQAGLGSLDDDALAGFLGGCRKLAAWASGMLLDGVAEFATRRPDDSTPGRATVHAAAVKKAKAAGKPADPPPWDEFAADELMPVLRLSQGGAARQAGLAMTLRYRLRRTLAAMMEGRIDLIRARIIAEATADLSAADAAAVEDLVLDRAGSQTYVALGIAVGKAVLTVDPAGAIRRRKRAEKQARVERWREYDGTGALSGRNLPPDDTLAADQALTARAVELRAAGLDGPLDYLRAIALIDQITGRDSRLRRAEPGEPGPAAGREEWDNRDEWPAMDASVLDDGGGTRPPSGSGGPGGRDRKHKQARKRRGKRVQARVNLTIPVKTLLGLGITPGEAGPFGPLDPAAARDLARTAAAHPGTRWCLTVTGEDGRAVAHGCARGPRPWAGQHPRAGPGPRDGPGSRDGPAGARALITRFLAGLDITLTPIAATGCDHHDAEPGYTPSRRLRHKIHARTPTCSYWGCRRPAAQCDDDHTTAWQAGGLTCQCNLAPLCRRHHRMKQRQGWRLEQPAPGTMTWHTPAGRTYITLPAQYSS